MTNGSERIPERITPPPARIVSIDGVEYRFTPNVDGTGTLVQVSEGHRLAEYEVVQ